MLIFFLSLFIGVSVAGGAASYAGFSFGKAKDDDHDAIVVEEMDEHTPQAPAHSDLTHMPVVADDHDTMIEMDHAAMTHAPAAEAIDAVETMHQHMVDTPVVGEVVAGDHSDHDMVHEPIALPKTDQEIEAFVAGVRNSHEMHAHDMGSSMASEHMAALDLVPRDEATHIAVNQGAWDDAATWYNGEIPGDGARVLIPEGVHVTYGHFSEAELFTLRVDGNLSFADDADSQMMVDTIVISPDGELTMGTQEDPIPEDVNIDIVFVNNGPIDTDWDPMLLSRGMVAHGRVNIHGAEKETHLKVVDDPAEGDTWVDFAAAPEGWQVGDKIVIAGTHYDGYPHWEPSAGYAPSEDEVRYITQIDGGRVHFDDPLIHDHDAPRADLKTSVANYTRNVSFETEDAETAEVFERGHVMFMHNDDVDVRYAEFDELGRTDKSEAARNANEFEDIASDSNVKGRYSFHFHRAGMDDLEDPGMAVGNAVFGSPGWGFVHHDSNAILDNNATFDTFGAGYVAESGNETGAWTNNIAIFSKGNNWQDPKIGGNDNENFDLGRTGDGFWFQGRMVESTGNIAVSVNNGYVYYHRGAFGDDGNIMYDSDTSPISDVFYGDEIIGAAEHPILQFTDNEAFASKQGIFVVKSGQAQGHDVQSVFDGFTAWNVKFGAEFQYTSHYILKDFDLIGREQSELSYDGVTGIKFDNNTADMIVVNPKIEHFEDGIDLFKLFSVAELNPAPHNFHVVNPTFIDVDREYKNYDPEHDTILETSEVPHLEPDLVFDEPLTYREGNPHTDTGARILQISGTKTDSLGKVDFPTAADNYSLSAEDVRNVLVDEGYYTTSEGQNYFLLDLYFSDRLTGETFVESHPVLLDDNVPVESTNDWFYGDSKFNGVRELGADDGQETDDAALWATLTDGQIILSETPDVVDEEPLEEVFPD